MAIKRTNKYWQARSEQRLLSSERDAVPYLNKVVRTYERARQQTVRDVKAIYAAYYRKEGWDTAALGEIAPGGSIKRFRDNMKKAGLETVLPENYQGRMTRLELLNAQMWGEVKTAALRHNELEGRSHIESTFNGYYRTIFDVAKGTGVTPAFSTLNTRTVEGILGAKFYGENFSERIWGNTDKLAREVQGIIGSAIASGQGQEKTVREIRERFEVNKSSAARLVRTETNYFENNAEQEAYAEIGIKEWQFLATLDARTSEICRTHDGKIYPVGKGAIPPLHPNCVLPDTVVLSPDAEQLFKSKYSGDVLEFRTANGRRLSVTANHIMLTTRGWVRAKFIRKGDQIIHYRNWTELTKGSPTNNDSPTTIEQLFTSLGKSNSVVAFRVPATAKDFKGDVVVDSEVDIILPNRLLKQKHNVSVNKFLGNFGLVFTDIWGRKPLSRDRSLTKFLIGTALAADGIMGSDSIKLMFSGGFALGDDNILLSLATHYDARLTQTEHDNVRRNTEVVRDSSNPITGLVAGDNQVNIKLLPDGEVRATSPTSGNPSAVEVSPDGVRTPVDNFCDFLNAITGTVELDSVSDFTVRYYSGHVYDLSSVSTLYLANGFVSSNCRSTSVPVVEGFEPKERIARDSETGRNYYVGGGTTYGEWVGGLKAAEEIDVKKVMEKLQEAMLGASMTGRDKRLNSQPKTLSKPNVTAEQYAERIGVTLDYWNSETAASERAFVRQFTEHYKIRWIDRKMSRPDGNGYLPTNDFVLRGIEYELKTPRHAKYSSIANLVRKSVPKGKDSFMVNLGDRKLSDKLRGQLENYNVKNPNNQINRLNVWTRGEIVKIKLK
jgi:SPP1 gp7 family putative phage head morphogenesis protein